MDTSTQVQRLILLFLSIGFVAVAFIGLRGVFLGNGLSQVITPPSVESQLSRLSPQGGSVGFAVPASGSSVPVSLSAQCNPDGSATFTWGGGSNEYNYSLDNKTESPLWEFTSVACNNSVIKGDYCYQDVSTKSLTVGAGNPTRRDYAFSFSYNTYFDDSGSSAGAGSVIGGFLDLFRGRGEQNAATLIKSTNTGKTTTITCGPPQPTTCSLAVEDCTIQSAGGTCNATAAWSAQNALDNVVKVALVYPNGYEDLWSRYGWPTAGYAPADYSGAIAGLQYAGTYTAKVYDKSNVVCATDPFTVSATVCAANVPYIETDYPSILRYCEAKNGPLAAGMTYPSSMSCNAAPGWQPYGPSCTLPSCDCPPPVPASKPNLQTLNLSVVKNGVVAKKANFVVGETATFIATALNQGAVAVSSTTPYVDRFEFSSDDGNSWASWVDVPGVALDPFPGGLFGGAKNELATKVMNTVGTFKVRHYVDRTDVIDETTNTDNVSTPADYLTITVNSIPAGTGTIGGYHVDQNRQLANPSVVILAGAASSSGNPYLITGVPAGTTTVTSNPLAGYQVSYCVHSVANCTLATSYTVGSSVSVTVPDGSNVDVWWMYTNLLPDFISLEPNFSVVGGYSHPAGTSVSILATAANMGPGTVAGGRTDKFYAKLASTTTWTEIALIGGTNPMGIWAGAPPTGVQNESVNHVFSTAGTYDIKHCVDASASVTETDENNNCLDSTTAALNNRRVTITNAPIVTLELQNESAPGWIATNISVATGTTIGVRWTATNVTDNCIGTGFSVAPAGNKTSQTLSGILPNQASPYTTNFGIKCFSGLLYGEKTLQVTVNPLGGGPSGSPTLVVTNPRVHRNATTTIIANPGGETGCSVTSTDPGGQGGPKPIPSAMSYYSQGVRGETRFTLSCNAGVPAVATVTVIPFVEEI